MKNLLKIAAVLSLGFILTSCYETTPKAPTTTKGPINTEGDCMKAGGKWEKVGLAGTLACVLTTKDAGKSCTDSTQCEERCLAVTDPNNSGNTIGQCQATNQPFGCFAEMENGQPGPALCID